MMELKVADPNIHDTLTVELSFESLKPNNNKYFWNACNFRMPFSVPSGIRPYSVVANWKIEENFGNRKTVYEYWHW